MQHKMKRFISLSGGVESTTMCILYGHNATAIWCDTGDEHDEMYQRIGFLESSLTDLHGGRFNLIKIKPNPKIKGQHVTKLSEGIKAFAFMPSPGARYCTDRFKIAPIEKFLKSAGRCELLIGLNAEETPGKLRIGNFEKLKNVTYRYPLHEEGYDRDDCEEILRQYGLHPNFPIYMSRGGCKFCFFKSKAEYKALYILDNKTFMEGWELEKSVQDRRKKYFSIIPNFTFQQIADEVETEKRLWGNDRLIDMYKPYAQTKVCGAFCHR